jgi:hypothetical protein
MNGASARAIYVHWRIAIPDAEGVGPLGQPAFPVVGDVPSWRHEGYPVGVIGLNQTQPDLHPQRGKHAYLDVQGEPHGRRGYTTVCLATISTAVCPVHEGAALMHRVLSSSGVTQNFIQVQLLI